METIIGCPSLTLNLCTTIKASKPRGVFTQLKCEKVSNVLERECTAKSKKVGMPSTTLIRNLDSMGIKKMISTLTAKID